MFGRASVIDAFDPDRHDWLTGWVCDGSPGIPRLRHGYGFAGYRDGALLGITHDTPSLQHAADAMADLAAWAREPWRQSPVLEASAARRRWRVRLARAADVAIVVLAVALLRRTR